MHAHSRSSISATSRSLFKRLPLEGSRPFMVRSLVLKLGGTHQTLVPENIQGPSTRTSLRFAALLNIYIVFPRKAWRWPVYRISLLRSRYLLGSPDPASGSKYGEGSESIAGFC